jgi:hypothetical protein
MSAAGWKLTVAEATLHSVPNDSPSNNLDDE